MAAVTRLGLYGGSRSLYGSFAGKVEQVVDAVVRAAGGSPRKARKARARRRVLIDGRLYTVTPEEEARLLREWLAREQAALEEVETPAERQQLVRVVKRVEKRVEKAVDRAAEWRAHLEAEDEEIISLYAAMY